MYSTLFLLLLSSAGVISDGQPGSLDGHKEDYVTIDESIKWDWKPFLDHGYKVPINDDVSSSDWNTSPGHGFHGLVKKTRTEAKLESDLYTEFKRFLMNYWEESGLEGRVSVTKDAVKKPTGNQVTFSEPPFDVQPVNKSKELPFFINRYGPRKEQWMKLKFHYEKSSDDSWSYVHRTTVEQLKGIKCLVGKPGIPCQVNRAISHPSIANVTINYKCFALRPSVEKNFLEVHAKTNRPPSDTSPLVTFYDWIKTESMTASDKFGKSKTKLEEINKLIKEKKINLGINLEERKELDTPFKYVPVRDLMLNYFDKPWLRIRKDEDGRGINNNRPITYDKLPMSEVNDKLTDENVMKSLLNGTINGCKSASPVSNDYKSYHCSSREMAYVHARSAGKGREPLEEWHLKGNPFKGHTAHKQKDGKKEGKSSESNKDGSEITDADPDVHSPHFRPRTGPTGFDVTPTAYHYNWKEWPSFFVLPQSKNSFGAVIAYNEYVPTSSGMFTHFDTSFDPYFNDDTSHYKYGDSINTKKIGEYTCYASDLSILDKQAMTEWKTIKPQ